MTDKKNNRIIKRSIIAIILIAAAGAGIWFWLYNMEAEAPSDIASGNGRVEATQVDIATKNNGQIVEILSREGDFVEKGQVIARMDTKSLQARHRQAKAALQQAHHAKTYTQALVQQRKSEAAVAKKDFERSQATYKSNKFAIAPKQLDHDRAAMKTAQALLDIARAQVLESEEKINFALAKTDEIETFIEDSIITTPIRGRVLYRLAEPGEILPSGGKILTVLDLSDVYMTIFLPTAQAGRVRIGAKARLLFDALPDIAVPAKVSFVAPNAQFTPKAVETRAEREKLMFRIKVKIDPDLLMEHMELVKTGVPGVAYVRLDSQTNWPENVQKREWP